MDVNACDKCGKTAPLQILNTHRFGICVGCGFPIVRGDEFDNARLEAVQGDECHLNMPERIHEEWYTTVAGFRVSIRSLIERYGDIDFSESFLDITEYPEENKHQFVGLGLVYPESTKKPLMPWPHGNKYSRIIEVAPKPSPEQLHGEAIEEAAIKQFDSINWIHDTCKKMGTSFKKLMDKGWKKAATEPEGPKCQCTYGQKMTGDGYYVCNPPKCNVCAKEVSGELICERCNEYYCEDCGATYNQFTQIDFNCCKTCETRRNP